MPGWKNELMNSENITGLVGQLLHRLKKWCLKSGRDIYREKQDAGEEEEPPQAPFQSRSLRGKSCLGSKIVGPP